jgi:hypothetical protein
MLEREKGWNFQEGSQDMWKCSTTPDGTLSFVFLFRCPF